jgi:hypothetical protein
MSASILPQPSVSECLTPSVGHPESALPSMNFPA